MQLWELNRERRRARAAGLALTCCLLLVAWLPVPAPALPAPAAAAALPQGDWVYLRDGLPLAPGDDPVEVLAVGDVMPGRGVAAVDEPLAGVEPWLQAADLAVGNLECVLGAEGTARPGPYRLRAPSGAAAMLARAGFDVLGLANNHALDYGPEGLAGTAVLLEWAGIDAVGPGPGMEAAFRPTVREVRGLRLAFLAFNAVPDPDGMPAAPAPLHPTHPGTARQGKWDGVASGVRSDAWVPAAWDPERGPAAVAAARANANAVIVLVHWGYEYDRRSDPGQRDMARALLDAGADLVVGHHPHVVQETATAAELGLEERHGLVAYSLGNLLFDQAQPETRRGLVLRAFFDRDGLRAVQALPVQAGLRPGPIPPGPPSLQAKGGASSSPLAGEDPTGRIGPGERSPGEGSIDLTGDGRPETVRLEGEQVVVYEAGMEAWRGLPEWRVADLALGDPNDDGRAEIVLALWKPDQEGVLRSHPFIVGYRGGAYRVLWGGSSLANPIHEVELRDVDGDGAEEMLVLEEQGDTDPAGSTGGGWAVAAWRWHGWGFSLLWRSRLSRCSRPCLSR
jgi:poly-gamma-glutamate synthesis protein (capsule biosynthesis protein)